MATKTSFDPPVITGVSHAPEAFRDTALARAVRSGACVNCGKGAAPFCSGRCRAQFTMKVSQRAYELRHGERPPVKVGSPRKRQVYARLSKHSGIAAKETSTFGKGRTAKRKHHAS